MEFSDALGVPAPTRFSIAGGFALAVVFASFLHAPEVINETGPLGLFALDKWIHFGSYALIAFLIAYALLARTTWSLIAIVVVVGLLGAGVELIQSTIPWRTMEAMDVVANVAGTVFSLGLWGVVRRRRQLEEE